MGALISPKRFFSDTAIALSKLDSFFSHSKSLYNSRFAHPHELQALLDYDFVNPATRLLLGVNHFDQPLAVRPTNKRRELGNLLVVAPTRMGKGLLATSQLLTWPHSCMVNDIKGELFRDTAGYRSTLGKVYVIDPTGVGHRFDPTLGKHTDLELKSIAKSLLFKADEGEGEIFTQRAIRMLTPLFHAARLENIPLLQYIAQLINEPLPEVATRLNSLSPNLATRFLDGKLEETDFQNRFLLSAWGTLTARLDALLTDSVVRCFTTSDFTPQELMCGEKPITVYFRWSESDLLVLSPVIRLLWTSLIEGLTKTYDSQNGANCKPVLLLLDEAGRTAIPHLSDHASTVVGRRIYLWVAIQDLAQLDAAYGKARARTLRNNMESQIYYRPSDQETADFLEHALGKKSGFAVSQTLRQTVEASHGLSEQGIPLMTAQDIRRLRDQDIIGFHRSLRPFLAKRMDWKEHPVLIERRKIAPPRLMSLPPVPDLEFIGSASATDDRLDEIVDPDLLGSNKDSIRIESDKPLSAPGLSTTRGVIFENKNALKGDIIG